MNLRDAQWVKTQGERNRLLKSLHNFFFPELLGPAVLAMRAPPRLPPPRGTSRSSSAYPRQTATGYIRHEGDFATAILRNIYRHTIDYIIDVRLCGASEAWRRGSVENGGTGRRDSGSEKRGDLASREKSSRTDGAKSRSARE